MVSKEKYSLNSQLTNSYGDEPYIALWGHIRDVHLQLVCETTLETAWTGFLHLYYKIKHLNTIDDYGSFF